jgi:hypothetical protein
MSETPVCERWQGQWRLCVPTPQRALEAGPHSRQAQMGWKEHRCKSISSQTSPYVGNAVTQRGLQSHFHSAVPWVQETQQYDGLHLHPPQVRCARAHDQTVAEDYFAAMERVEQRLEIVPESKQQIEDEVVKVQEPIKVLQLIEQLEIQALGYEERLDITLQLRELFGAVQVFEPVMVLA